MSKARKEMVSNLVVMFSKAFQQVIDQGTRMDATMDELSLAQVLVAKVILKDPMNKDNLNAEIEIEGQDNWN
jgi:hypothetical protein